MRHIGGGNRGGIVEQAQPHQRPHAATARIGQHSQARFERQPGFIGDISGQRAAVFTAGGIGIGQNRLHLVRAVGDKYGARIFEQQRISRALFACVIKKDENLPVGHRPSL